MKIIKDNCKRVRQRGFTMIEMMKSTGTLVRTRLDQRSWGTRQLQKISM